jgi:hypothetical protein
VRYTIFVTLSAPVIPVVSLKTPVLERVPALKDRPVPIVISSATPVAAVDRPSSLFVAMLVEITGVAPPELVIGEVADTDVTVPLPVAAVVCIVPSLNLTPVESSFSPTVASATVLTPIFSELITLK